jgi:hypothetical protein
MCLRWSQESTLPLGNVPAAGWRCQWWRCVEQALLREAVGWRQVLVRFPPRPLQGRWSEGGRPCGSRCRGGWVSSILIVRGSAVRSREEIHRQSGFWVLPLSKTAGVLGKLAEAAKPAAAATSRSNHRQCLFFHLHQFKRVRNKWSNGGNSILLQ